MRILIASLFLLVAGFHAATAQTSGEPPFEVVKNHVDIEVNPDGSFLRANEVAYRVLNAQGLRALQQVQLSYTDGFQSLEISEAYTLKADGTKIPVAHDGMLYGRGASNMPGFEDLIITTVVFPNVEIGDQVVLVTVLRQQKPWVANQFAIGYDFNRLIANRDTQVSITAPTNYLLSIDASGVEGGQPTITGGKTRWTWSFHNDKAEPAEPDALPDSDDGAHVFVSSFSDYGAVARAATGWFQDKAAVTPEIQSLADQLTAGISGHREQARKLYEWVSSQISYVQIVLGAGGFVPHPAAMVLRNRYGDCKDHVVLLQALLAAKGIKSTPALIAVGNTYRLPAAATPFAFNHVITYIPEFDLFADSTVQLAPFGVLPGSDAGKSVVLTELGKVVQTPSASSANNSVGSVEKIRISPDGTAEGDSRISATGAASIDLRSLMGSIPATSEPDYFRQMLGPGAEGTLYRGDSAALTPNYSYSAHFRVNNAASFPGPGALPPWLGYKPFYFTFYIGGSLPAQRTKSYGCVSISATEDVTIEFPPGVKIMSLPKNATMRTEGMVLQLSAKKTNDNIVHEINTLHIDHPQAICTADYYNRVHEDLQKMVAALKAQILYQ
ncbi:MAG TPA: DUF3857 and transglutaminase domain-containing protein [Rhizomicrobium sp.]|nr:DUF3857 and transglutaminase domain-containing protein [Rhizomicrobium sp.]